MRIENDPTTPVLVPPTAAEEQAFEQGIINADGDITVLEQDSSLDDGE